MYTYLARVCVLCCSPVRCICSVQIVDVHIETGPRVSRSRSLGAVRRAIKKEKRRRGGRAAASEDAKLSVLERSLARLKQTRAERQVAESRRAALAQWKSSEREKVAAGKKPFFLKKRAQKELETEHRFEALAKGRGGKKKIEKLIEKRRKKNAAKDRRWLPEARRGAY